MVNNCKNQHNDNTVLELTASFGTKKDIEDSFSR